MENSVASFEDFEFVEFGESDQELLGLSHWEFIDASDGIGSDGLIASFDYTSASPMTNSIEAHNRRRHTRLVCVLDLAFETHLNDECLPGHEDDHDHDEGEDDDDWYGLDDELVPWSVSNKFGRERMRKLGKRNRSPYLFVRPGCVRGKHGLGLKHIH